MDRLKEYKKSRDPFTSDTAKLKRAEKTECRRRQQRDKHVAQRREIVVAKNHSECLTDDEEISDDRSVKLMKWKEEKALKKKLDDKNKKPVFKIGIPHHNFYSPPPLNDDKLKRHNKKYNNTIDNKKKIVSRATERRSGLKTAASASLAESKSKTSKITTDKVMNPTARCTRSKKKAEAAVAVSSETNDKQPIAPKNNESKKPIEINPTPLFGQYSVSIEPDTPKEQMNKHEFTFVIEKNTNNDDEKYLNDISTDKIENEEINKPIINKNDELTDPSDPDTSIESVVLRVSSQESLDSNENNKIINNKHLNIEKESTSPDAALFSPFITTTRGKSSSRKEYKKRMSMRTSCSPVDNEIPTKDTVMKNLNITIDEEEHTAQYYRSLGEREANRLKQLCNDWRKIQFTQDTPEESIHHINSAIGQAELLLNKKFGRFQQLVDNCEDGKGEMLVRCRDLQGFWELVSREIVDCDSRFFKLDKLKNNNWIEEEEDDDTKIYQNKKPVNKKKNIVNKKINTAKSQMKLFIEAQRKKKLQEQTNIDNENNENIIEDNKFKLILPKKCLLSSEPFVPSSPVLSPRTPMRRQLTDSAKKMALASMKITQICKTPEVQLDDSISYVNSHQTPGKGILKKINSTYSTNEKQLTKPTCKVNFNDTIDEKELPIDDDIDDEENNDELSIFKFNTNTTVDSNKIDLINESMITSDDEDKIITLEKKKLTFDDSLSPDEPLLDDKKKSSDNNNYFFNNNIIDADVESKVTNSKLPCINVIAPTPTTQRILPSINIISATVDKKLRSKKVQNSTDYNEDIETPRKLRIRSLKTDATQSENKTCNTSKLDLSTTGMIDKENNVQKRKSITKKNIKYEDINNVSLNVPSRKSNRLSLKHSSEKECNIRSITLSSTPISAPRRKRKIESNE